MEGRKLSKRVKMSPRDENWNGVERDEKGNRYYQVVVLGPWTMAAFISLQRGYKVPWFVMCHVQDDRSLIRRFPTEELAVKAYEAIHPQTEIKTLLGRGFKFD